MLKFGAKPSGGSNLQVSGIPEQVRIQMNNMTIRSLACETCVNPQLRSVVRGAISQRFPVLSSPRISRALKSVAKGYKPALKTPLHDVIVVEFVLESLIELWTPPQNIVNAPKARAASR